MSQERCTHTPPDYYGGCERCGVRLEAPSRAMRARAEREGLTIVESTGTFAVSERALVASRPARWTAQ